mmetsp:Transcript_77645/g.225330  ORF Transcript_77645/g.225330 Transcript_77645/m.225330 type:complete len:341 (-) Transcript_77645:33-1055(-)
MRRAVAGDAVLRVPRHVPGVLLHVAVASAVAMLAAEDVGVKRGVVVGVHAVPDIGAQLHEEDLAPSIGVDLRKLLLGFLRRHAEAQGAQPRSELAAVNPAVGTSVHLLEDLPQLCKPEDVEQQGVKLSLLHPVVAVPVLQRGLLVGAHQRRLGVQPLGPRTAFRHLDHQLVDLRQADDVVAIVVEAAPQLLQIRGVDQAVGLHVGIQRHPQLHELVVARGHRRATHVGILPPLPVLLADDPLLLAVGWRGGLGGLHVSPTLVAVIHHFADYPPALAGVEQVARRHAPSHPRGHAVVLDLHGLIDVADEGEPSIGSPTLDLDGGRHGQQRVRAVWRARPGC